MSHFLAASSETFADSANFFNGGGAFPVALGAVVDFGELGVHYSSAAKVQRKRNAA